jgi:hypothetical protein
VSGNGIDWSDIESLTYNPAPVRIEGQPGVEAFTGNVQFQRDVPIPASQIQSGCHSRSRTGARLRHKGPAWPLHSHKEESPCQVNHARFACRTPKTRQKHNLYDSAIVAYLQLGSWVT